VNAVNRTRCTYFLWEQALGGYRSRALLEIQNSMVAPWQAPQEKVDEILLLSRLKAGAANMLLVLLAGPYYRL